MTQATIGRPLPTSLLPLPHFLLLLLLLPNSIIPHGRWSVVGSGVGVDVVKMKMTVKNVQAYKITCSPPVGEETVGWNLELSNKTIIFAAHQNEMSNSSGASGCLDVALNSSTVQLTLLLRADSCDSGTQLGQHEFTCTGTRLTSTFKPDVMCVNVTSLTCCIGAYCDTNTNPSCNTMDDFNYTGPGLPGPFAMRRQIGKAGQWTELVAKYTSNEAQTAAVLKTYVLDSSDTNSYECEYKTVNTCSLVRSGDEESSSCPSGSNPHSKLTEVETHETVLTAIYIVVPLLIVVIAVLVVVIVCLLRSRNRRTFVPCQGNSSQQDQLNLVNLVEDQPQIRMEDRESEKFV